MPYAESRTLGLALKSNTWKHRASARSARALEHSSSELGTRRAIIRCSKAV